MGRQLHAVVQWREYSVGGGWGTSLYGSPFFVDVMQQLGFVLGLGPSTGDPPGTLMGSSPVPETSPTTGLITSTSTTSRQIQFGLKLLW